ncbi:MAG: S8 family serine peptidase [Ornithinimicrobium sp.]
MTQSSADVSSARPSRAVPVPRLSAQQAQRLGARVLDRPTRPGTDSAAGSQATAYLGRCLLVTGLPTGRRQDVVTRLQSTAAVQGLTVTVDERLDGVAQQLADLGPVARDIVDRFWVSTVHLDPPSTDDPGRRRPIDAWPVLQDLRGEGLSAADVRLDHPAFACHGFGGSATIPTGGGRRPVSMIIPDPADGLRRSKRRRPIVVVPDTGIGKHPWFRDEDEVTRTVEVGGVQLGIGGDMNVSRPEPRNPLDGSLPRYIGHGTFIAGIIRQQCPRARIEGIPIMDDYGGVNERLLINTLVALLVRQAVAITQGRAQDIFDVLSLSVGYYHEEPGDEATDPVLAGVLRALGSWGVCVVAAAGNDGTTAPFHPATFAGQMTGLAADTVPLVSVGALNPNKSVAHFSNSGPWVSCERVGVEVVSTVPIDAQGTAQPGTGSTHGDRKRAAVDPDDFSGGFGTWSGTSFAAPLLAGQIAAHLTRSRSIDSADRAATVQRGWRAVRREIPAWRPPRIKSTARGS